MNGTSATQTLKLAGKPYVVVPERDFRKLLDRLASYEAEERSDIAVIRKRLRSGRTLIPLARVKKELGL